MKTTTLLLAFLLGTATAVAATNPPAKPAAAPAAAPAAKPAAAPAAPATNSNASATEKFKLKPGARGKNCLGCHPAFEATMKLPYLHTPVKNGGCADCHNPHTADHGKLLAEDANKVCQVCHADLTPPKAVSVHKAVIDGNCVKCHDPHGSQTKNNLIKAGAELCFGCHKELAAGVKNAKFKHSPV
jgi:predicted CXXCH cytochrome family protein